MHYDLEERTKKFSKAVIKVITETNINDINRNIILQLSKSATSVGANYCEANGASSKKDFRNKIFLCKKEIQETKYWIELLVETDKIRKDKMKNIWKEAHELSLIFGKIASTLRN